MDSIKNRLSMTHIVLAVCILSMKDRWIQTEIRLPLAMQESSITVIGFDS
jgi:hypothetical protein